MQIIRTSLAVLGGLTLAAGVALGASLGAGLHRFDAKAATVYWDMARILAITGNAAEATVWKSRVAEGLSFEDVDESLQSLAADLNIRDVGALPLGEQVAAMQGTPWRQLKIYLYCNPLTAARMIEYSDAYAAWLPCRVSLLEDATGALWLYTLNMDLMIHGGHPLPDALRAEAEDVRRIMLALLERGAAGEF